MKTKAALLLRSVLVFGPVFLALTSLAPGCGDDDDDAASTRTGQKGEVCQAARDCAPGLACMPAANSGFGAGGTCVLGTFNVAPTNRECAITECTVADDCCLPNEPSCDTTRVGCENGQCITSCTDDPDCGSGFKCIAGRCGQCSADPDCQASVPGGNCVNSKCQPACQTDGDCSGFDRCVNARCIPGGCQNDRECIASSHNVEATCGTDGKCVIPCQTDLECGNPTNYQFFSCLEHQCVYVGCSTDKDCRFFLLGQSGVISTSSSSSSGGGIPTNEHIVCRDKL